MRGSGIAFALTATLAVTLSGCQMTGALGRDSSATAGPTLSPAAALEWNAVAIEATGVDHTPPDPGETRPMGENMGPGRASRAMAIVHIAMFEAVNAIHGGFASYTRLPRAGAGASMEAAIARAAHDTLVALYPGQQDRFDRAYDTALARIVASGARALGLEVGKNAAASILELRANDGSDHAEPEVGVDHTCSNEPGRWRPDPVSGIRLALGARWSEVKPFVMRSADQFRCTTPPAPGSAEYRAALQEARELGGDGAVTPTRRTLSETITGIFWGYDGGPNLCAPPRLYNQLTTLIAVQKGSDLVELTRLLALVNVAMADAGIASWESKYHHDFWRPVTAIREAGEGAGPTGEGDRDPQTAGDPTFTPLGAPASNSRRVNFTPPFPSYPSGHATFGGALFQTLRKFYGTDDLAFDFVSDEFNGQTTDSTGQVRPRIQRHFDTLSQAEEENGRSRIYLGIHFSFDKTAGIEQGRKVADLVASQLYRPLAP